MERWMKDAMCDGYGLTGPSPGDKLINACSDIGSFLFGLASEFAHNALETANIVKDTAKSVKLSLEDEVEAEMKKLLSGIAKNSKNVDTSMIGKIPEGLKIEDILNEDNAHLLPKEAPGWWTANGGTYDSWAEKVITEAENTAYDATHDDYETYGS